MQLFQHHMVFVIDGANSVRERSPTPRSDSAQEGRSWLRRAFGVLSDDVVNRTR